MFLVICCEDDIVLYVFLFIKEYIKNLDWWYWDVVVMVFGCILEGLEFSQFKLLVIQVMFILIELMKDFSVVV